MPSRRTGAARRAIIVAVALYGLLVQAFLAGLAPAEAAAAAGSAGQTICEHQAGGDPVPDHGGHHQHDCCLAACMAAAMAAPSLPRVDAIAWPARIAVRVAWSFAPIQARAPPGSPDVSARGPPRI